MYGFESWTVKKAECQRIDAFELWFWRRLLRVPWTARRSNQSIVKKISPEYSLEGLMQKLKLQYFDHLMRSTDLIWKDPDAGKDWRREEKGTTEDEMLGWHHWLDGHEFEQAPGEWLSCCNSYANVWEDYSNYFGESVSHSVMFESLWPHGLYVACLAPLSMEFSSPEY